jgi:hypothetical protein
MSKGSVTVMEVFIEAFTKIASDESDGELITVATTFLAEVTVGG